MKFEMRPTGKVQLSDLIFLRLESGAFEPKLRLYQLQPSIREIPLSLRKLEDNWWGTEFTLEQEGLYKIEGSGILREFQVLPRNQLLGGKELLFSALGSGMVFLWITLYVFKRRRHLIGGNK